MGIHLEKFVHTERGKIIMSIILGFGLASLFRTICKEKDCIVFNAAPLEDFQNKIYKKPDGNKCYKYVPIATTCNSNKKIVTFADNLEK